MPIACLTVSVQLWNFWLPAESISRQRACLSEKNIGISRGVDQARIRRFAARIQHLHYSFLPLGVYVYAWDGRNGRRIA